MRDLYSRLAYSQLVDPATITADTNSTQLDLQGFESAVLAAVVGASGDTLSSSVKIELEVEHADADASGNPDTWEDVPDAELLNFVAGTNDGTFAVIDAADEDDKVYVTGYIGTRRFVRVVINLTGTHTNGTPIGVMGIRGDARDQPATS